jgi:hypothetical protein
MRAKKMKGKKRFTVEDFQNWMVIAAPSPSCSACRTGKRLQPP